MVDDPFKDVLIMDCEAANPYYGCPTSEQKLRVMGCYSYNDKKYHFLYNKVEILEMLNRHKYIVGFNNTGGDYKGDHYEGYDNLLLASNGYSEIFAKGKDNIYRIKKKINIDLMLVTHKRAPIIKIKEGILQDLLMRFSLEFITNTLHLVDESSGKIKDFDYNLLLPEVSEWTEETKNTIESYLLRDIEVTKKLYEFYEDYFKVFKDFISQEDIDSKKYITVAPAVLAYKVLCKELGVKEEYSNEIRTGSFIGGYVALPTGEEFHGNILLFDFSSLYPNLFIMGGLFGNNCTCCTNEEKWHGDGFFNVEGYYCKKKQTALGEVIKKIYLMRSDFKKNNDNREYACKIIMNSSYGAISNPAFKNIYNLTAAKDCTTLGRNFVQYARKRFKEEGFINIMTDTDSVAVLVPKNKTKEDAQQLVDNIVKELLAHMPFPW